jgi:hypothetical protein
MASYLDFTVPAQAGNYPSGLHRAPRKLDILLYRIKLATATAKVVPANAAPSQVRRSCTANT